MVQRRRPGVILQPRTHQALKRGVRQIVEAICPTLGPIPHYVGVQRDGKPPELLDDAGLITRRIIGLRDPDEDMGAMYIRSVLWRMHEEVGDGTATTAVLFWAIFRDALRYLAAGGNAMLLRRHLEAGMRDIVSALDAQTIPVQPGAQFEALALSLCHEPSLPHLLAEAFETVGADGRIEVRKGYGRESALEFVPGTYWESGLVPNQTAAGDPLRRVDLGDARILISDLAIEDPEQLAPLIRWIELDEIGPVGIVAMKFSDKVLNLLRFINHRKRKTHVVAIKTPEAADVTRRKAVLGDIALLTGGRVLLDAAHDQLTRMKLEDFGTARYLWADPSFFGIINGRGDPRAVYDCISQLKARYQNQELASDPHKTLLRIGQLQGGTVTILVGGITEYDIERRKDLAERTIQALRLAMREGAVPGGGVAFLNCQQALQNKLSSANADERAAYRILHTALEAPLRTLVKNAGHEWGAVAAGIHQAGSGHGCDIRSGSIVDVCRAGIYDVARVTREAVQRAVNGAALLLTTDALVHRRNPQAVYNPR